MNQQITELKAKAYDLLAALQTLELQLQEVNKQISELQQKENASRNDSNDNN